MQFVNTIRKGYQMSEQIELWEVLEVLNEAKETIKTWHNMGQAPGPGTEELWKYYNKSPEMKRLNEMIERLEGGRESDIVANVSRSDTKIDVEELYKLAEYLNGEIDECCGYASSSFCESYGCSTLEDILTRLRGAGLQINHFG